MFGRNVTPNQLAEEFVLLDNFYATGGNSAEGHQWLTQANEVDYCMWPGYAGRSYPYDGTDPIAYSKNAVAGLFCFWPTLSRIIITTAAAL
jgi:hypothetical protein